MENICLDTDVLVDFLRNKFYAVDYIDSNRHHNLCTTIVNLFELYHGAKISAKQQENLEKIKILEKNITILNFSALSVEIVSDFSSFLKKKGTVIDTKDLFIGALAFEHKCTLKTNNIKHFNQIPGLNIC
ncbi:type II toxin-antitoxin system VapC family toxin [Candidatus Woesearchaeota archaeon]|nr:type II toxin-antitoxin system VapC family toxin [Candidatus Woesearchaeota archaeon]